MKETYEGGDVFSEEAVLKPDSYPYSRCRKSGWPLCNADCEEAVAHNPEVVIPHQTGEARDTIMHKNLDIFIGESRFAEGTFEIESYEEPCYLYECVLPIRTLLLQKTSPSKFKKVYCISEDVEYPSFL